jgi:amino acid transporter
MVSLVVGAGIFGLPAFAARTLGPAAVFGYLACILLLALMGLCLAEAGSRVPDAGGIYGYTTAAYGPLAGAIAGHLLWFANGAVANAAVAVLMVDTLGALVPVFTTPIPRFAVLLGYYIILATINVRGTRYGLGLTQWSTAIKIAPLVLLVALGVPHIHLANLRITTWPHPAAVEHTAVLLFFAFTGFESGLSMSGEIVAPERTVPRALLLALSMVAILYLGLQFVAQGVLGPALATAGDTPLVATALAAFGPVGQTFIVVATLFSTAGLLAADILASPRALYALGRSGALPSVMGRVHPRFDTPAVAVITYTTICAILACSGTFRSLAALGASGTLCLYLLCCTGLVFLRQRGVGNARRPFVVPGGITVPVLATLAICLVLTGLDWSDFILLGATLVVIVVLSFVRRGAMRVESADALAG